MSIPTVGDIAAALEAWADPGYAESYDNTGLQVGNAFHKVHSALIALDLTPAVVDEADQQGVSLIITHHPLIFKPLRRLTGGDLIGNLLLHLVHSNIALFSIHTNLDAAPDGVSIDLARRLGVRNSVFLRPREASNSGLGAIGALEPSMQLRSFVQHVSERLQARGLRYVGNPNATVRRVAVCGGSGSRFTAAAMQADADAYVTADIKYHQFFEVLDLRGAPRMALIDAGHYETEQHVEALLCRWLTDKFPQVRFRRTFVRTSPIRTLLD